MCAASHSKECIPQKASQASSDAALSEKHEVLQAHKPRLPDLQRLQRYPRARQQVGAQHQEDSASDFLHNVFEPPLYVCFWSDSMHLLAAKHVRARVRDRLERCLSLIKIIEKASPNQYF